MNLTEKLIEEAVDQIITGKRRENTFDDLLLERTLDEQEEREQTKTDS